MTRLFALLAALLIPVLAQAQGLSEGQILRGRFVQERFLTGFQAPLKSEGSFMLAPGRGLIWRAETPFAATTILSPAGLVQEVRGTETMRLPGAKIPFMSRLYTMLGGALTGDWNALDDLFAVERSGNAAAWHLVLTPRRADDPSMPIRTITIDGGRFVDTVELLKPDGDHDRLSFRDQALSDDAPSQEEIQLLTSAGRQ